MHNSGPVQFAPQPSRFARLPALHFGCGDARIDELLANVIARFLGVVDQLLQPLELGLQLADVVVRILFHGIA